MTNAPGNDRVPQSGDQGKIIAAFIDWYTNSRDPFTHCPRTLAMRMGPRGE